MGFFRRIFGAKKAGSSPAVKEKRRWSFTGSSNTQSTKRNATPGTFDDNNLDSNKHAIAVAAATAAVAEAALAAAQAAAEVVRLTSSNGGGGRGTAPINVYGNRRRWMAEFAAVRIQSAFRGYLARRALRALKALVKLQALVRGHIVRKQTSDMLRRMQTLVRLQARARAARTQLTESCRSAGKSSQTNHSRCGSSSNFRDIMLMDEAKLDARWLDHWMQEGFLNNSSNVPIRNRQDEEKSDKILEVDTWKPHKKAQSIGTFKTSQLILASDYNRSFSTFDSPSKISTKATNPYAPSGEDSSLNSLKFAPQKDEAVFRTVENSPRTFSPSSRPGSSGRKGTVTPTKSDCSSWGFFNGYSGHPNYMANTESFRAKLRSQSAPRQRLDFEKYGLTNRSVQDYYDADTVSERGNSQQTNSRNGTQPATARLNRVGSTNLR